MDGDFAPMVELVKLRRKYGFLLVLDDVSFLSNVQDFTFQVIIWSLSMQLATD